MVEVFFYMYFVGLGVASGIATVGILVWKIIKREKRTAKNKKTRSVVA